MVQEENEIDLIEIVKKLWSKRMFILKVTVIFAILGVFVALFSAKEFSAGCTMVPQTGDKKSAGGLGGLAAMAGISLGSMGGEDVLSPKIYPKIVSSVPFQKELMLTPIKFDEFEQPVRLLDYYTADEYQKFSLGGALLKYTIGLPGVILEAIRGEEPKMEWSVGSEFSIQSLSKEEDACVKILKNKVALTINDKEGYVALSANMPEALAAAQLASKVQSMLQKYITVFKIEKAQANLTFIEERYNEAKNQFEKKQEELAEFRDANRNFASALAKTTEERLSNEYGVALGVYSELAKQREQANIQVKENTPVFTIVEPVTIPTERSKPKRGLICVAFAFFGGFIALGLVLILPFFAQFSESRYLSRWKVEK